MRSIGLSCKMCGFQIAAVAVAVAAAVAAAAADAAAAAAFKMGRWK